MTRRNEIIKIATDVFKRKGVKGTSFEDIAREVGVKREAIYYYFKSRAEILAEVILPQSRSLMDSLNEIVESDRTSTEKLEAAVANHLEAYNPKYLEMSVALQEIHFFEKDEPLGELREIWREYGALWTSLIREGQRDGSFDTTLDAEAVSFGILGMFNWLSRWYRPDGRLAITDIVADYKTLILRGLLPNDSR